MTFRQIALPFAAGLAVGFLIARNWEAIRAAVAPVAQRVGRRTREAATLGREKLWEQRERFEDLMAEIREQDAQKAANKPAATA
jgi:hypothetical protein